MTAQQAWVEANPGLGLQPGQWASINPNGLEGAVQIAGSSTVFPLTQRLAERFQSAGFGGTIAEESIGSTAGFQRFCVAGDIDIANASRPITTGEYSACRANNRRPIEIRVGTDALAVIVSNENSFLTDVTQEELKQIFTTAVTWSDVNPAWPDEPIYRYIPGADSGTLDFFAETVLNESLADLPTETLVQILANNISIGLGRRLERDQRFFENAHVFDSPEAYNAVCASDTPATACTLPARSQQNIYDLVVTEVLKPDVLESWSLVDSIFHRAAIEAEQQFQYPNAELIFRSWLSPKFLTNPQSSDPVVAGVRTAILGSLWVIVITIIFSFPVGVGAAIYLEEYAIELSSRNLMLHRGRLHIIDFQDARMGPDTYDLASLLRDSYVDFAEAQVDDLIASFLALRGGTDGGAAPPAPGEFRRRFDLMSLQRNLKALGTFGHQATSRGNAAFVQYIPRTLTLVRSNMARNPRFSRLRELLATHLDELR
jgi:hypothetical protein